MKLSTVNRKYLNIIKIMSEKPTANIILSSKNTEQDKDAFYFHSFHSAQYWKP